MRPVCARHSPAEYFGHHSKGLVRTSLSADAVVDGPDIVRDSMQGCDIVARTSRSFAGARFDRGLDWSRRARLEELAHDWVSSLVGERNDAVRGEGNPVQGLTDRGRQRRVPTTRSTASRVTREPSRSGELR